MKSAKSNISLLKSLLDVLNMVLTFLVQTRDGGRLFYF